MRKSFIILTIGMIYVFCSSCRKEYTCICYSGWDGTPYGYVYKKSSDDKARRKCESFNQPYANDGTYGCHLE